MLSDDLWDAGSPVVWLWLSDHLTSAGTPIIWLSDWVTLSDIVQYCQTRRIRQIVLQCQYMLISAWWLNMFIWYVYTPALFYLEKFLKKSPKNYGTQPCQTQDIFKSLKSIWSDPYSKCHDPKYMQSPNTCRPLTLNELPSIVTITHVSLAAPFSLPTTPNICERWLVWVATMVAAISGILWKTIIILQVLGLWSLISHVTTAPINNVILTMIFCVVRSHTII